MSQLVEIGLVNAALATVMALGVWLVTRIWRQPVLVHALWVVVLLKLVTPPMLSIPWHLADEPATILPIAEPAEALADNHVDVPDLVAEKSAEQVDQPALKFAPAMEIAAGEVTEMPADTAPDANSFAISWLALVATAWLVGSAAF